MRSFCRAVSLSLLVLIPALLLAADSRVKLATIAPAGSVWEKTLKRMGADWRKATDGRVSLVVQAGGVQGTEAATVRKMRLNQLQAVALTQPGLASLDDAFNVFAIPFFFESNDELLHVLDELTPTIARRLESKGLVFLNWGHGGWTHVFTTEPVETIAELRKLKMFTTAGDDRMVRWYRENGFNPQELELTDVLMGLETGMIEAYPSPPYAALMMQWYRKTPYMLDVAVTPFVTATLVANRAWRGISEADRKALRASAQQVERRLATEVPRQDRSAVAQMERRRLKVTRPASAAALAEFRSAAESLAAAMRGSMIPADVYDLAIRERDAFRQRSASAR